MKLTFYRSWGQSWRNFPRGPYIYLFSGLLISLSGVWQRVCLLLMSGVCLLILHPGISRTATTSRFTCRLGGFSLSLETRPHLYRSRYWTCVPTCTPCSEPCWGWAPCLAHFLSRVLLCCLAELVLASALSWPVHAVQGGSRILRKTAASVAECYSWMSLCATRKGFYVHYLP